MANAMAVVFFPIPSIPVKSKAWGRLPLERAAVNSRTGRF
jgi:hypothetical protein